MPRGGRTSARRLFTSLCGTEQLVSAAEDPDLPELFDFLINDGVGQNAYAQDVEDFVTVFVDSKRRQLRFSAFAVANKVDQVAPLTKIAIMKRACRKKANLGFCANRAGELTSQGEGVYFGKK